MEIIKTILCPTDLSADSKKVIEFAQKIAISLHADLLLFFASHIPAKVSASASQVDSKYSREEDNARKQLIELTNNLKADPSNKGKNINYDFLWEDGLPLEAIGKVLKDRKIDLLVMGSSGSKKDKFESNASTFLDQINCPVIFLPSYDNFNPFSEIVYAFDAFRYSINTIVDAIQLLKTLKPNITFLHITEESDSKVESRFVKAKKHILENITYENVKFKIFTASDIVHGLNEYAENHSSDLIVMSNYRKSLIEKIFETKPSKKMAYHLNVPVLVMHTFSK
jgi:nucleotide-binding universal stress UspA family protein